MTSLHLHIEQQNGSRPIVIPFDVNETLKAFAERIGEQADTDGESILELALDTSLGDMSKLVRDVPIRHKELRLNRVCVEVHFESEIERHWFPTQARWQRVHRWACKKFDIAADAAANLELREGSEKGTPLNEREKIGDSDECRVVYLVKPGPEENG